MQTAFWIFHYFLHFLNFSTSHLENLVWQVITIQYTQVFLNSSYNTHDFSEIMAYLGLGTNLVL